MARPPKYSPLFAWMAGRMRDIGLKAHQIRYILGIGHGTYWRWRAKYPLFKSKTTDTSWKPKRRRE